MALTDTMLNVFRDHNFDLCTMCVCNNDRKVVGNVRGSDGGLYLPPSHLSPDEEAIACNCGFSAVVNRKLGYQSGLFYEDEVDLTGLHEGLLIERKKTSLASYLHGKQMSENTDIIDNVPDSLVSLIQQQSIDTLCSESSVVQRAALMHLKSQPNLRINIVEFKDGNELAGLALEQARLDDDGNLMSNSSNNNMIQIYMHKWAYRYCEGASCSQDLMRVMNSLQPHLQEAIQKKRVKSWEPVYNVRGPLTWRHFHRMAVRGTEDLAEPLPVPLILTGYDREWISVAPQGEYISKLI